MPINTTRSVRTDLLGVASSRVRITFATLAVIPQLLIIPRPQYRGKRKSPIVA